MVSLKFREKGNKNGKSELESPEEQGSKIKKEKSIQGEEEKDRDREVYQLREETKRGSGTKRQRDKESRSERGRVEVGYQGEKQPSRTHADSQRS